MRGGDAFRGSKGRARSPRRIGRSHEGTGCPTDGGEGHAVDAGMV